MNPFIGEVKLYGFGFAPKNYAQCLGQIMSIQQNTALFSILGTSYGGNGTTTFLLPNLAGSCAVGQGTCSTGYQWSLGQVEGQTNVAILTDEMPAHTHGMAVTGAVGTVDTPEGNQLARPFKGTLEQASKGLIYTNQPANTPLLPVSMAPAGNGEAHENMMPYLAINYAIALKGNFPARN